MSDQTMKTLKIYADVNLLGKDHDGPQILRLVSPMRKMSKAKIAISKSNTSIHPSSLLIKNGIYQTQLKAKQTYQRTRKCFGLNK